MSEPSTLTLHTARYMMRHYWPTIILMALIAAAVQAADEPWRQLYQGEQAAGEQIIALWQFQAGAETEDSSGRGHDLVLRGDSRFVPEGLFGSCLESFPSENDAAHGAMARSRPGLSPKGAFTLELWVKPKPELAAAGQGFLLDKQYYRREGDARADRDYQLLVRSVDGGRYVLDAYLGFGDDSAHYFSAPFALPVDEWTYLAFTYDGAGLGRFFVNGRLWGEAVRDGRGAVAPGPHPLVIGARVGSSNVGFPGLIDQVRIMNGAPPWLTPQITAVAAGGRSVYVRAEGEATMTVLVTNPLRRPLEGLQASLTVQGGASAGPNPVADIPALGRARVELPLDTLLKPGSYDLLAHITGWSGGEPVELSVEGELTIVPRPLPHVLPVIDWGIPELSYKVTDYESLKEIGFTHTLFRHGDVAHHGRVWAAGRPLVPSMTPDQTLRQLDAQLAAGLKHVVQLQPGGWVVGREADEEQKAKYSRVNRDGEPYPRAQTCGLFSEVQEFCYNIGASAGQTFGKHPALDGALIHSEIAYGPLCFHPHDHEAYREHSGRDIPDEAVHNHTIGASRRGEFVPHDGIIPDDHPILDYYRWFWNRGDGWYELHSQVHRGLKTGTHEDFWTFTDPAVRRPPVWGAGGEVDVISQWTYTYPDPPGIGLATDELFAMADGRPGQRVMKMTQIIWYRDQTAPELPEREEDRAEWEKTEPEAPFITIAPDHLREAFWLKLARPVQGIMYHGDQSLGMGNRAHTGSYRYTNPATRTALAQLVHGVAVPLGPALMQVPDPPAEVAMLESFASTVFGARGTWGYPAGWMADMHLVLQWARLQPRIVYEEKIIRDGLEGFKILVMPNCPVLPQTAYARIRDFQRRGGIVVGDQHLAAAITPDIIIRQPSYGSAPHERKAALQALSAQLRAELSPLYAPRADSDDPDMLVRLRQYANTEYLFAINDRRTYGDYVGHHGLVMEKGLRHRATVSLDKPGATVYDLLRSRVVRARNTPEGRLQWRVSLGPGEGRVYMATPRPVAGVRINIAPRQAESRAVEARVWVVDAAGEALQAVIPVQVDILDPEGNPAEFSGYYGAADGEVSLRLDLASNDAAGGWTIRARELASGMTAEAQFDYRP